MRYARGRWWPAIALALMGATGCSENGNDAASVQDAVTEGRHSALVRAVERATPGVVGVYVLTPPQSTAPGFRNEFFRRYFPDLPQFQDELVPQMGSGIVLDSRGYFLTNHHLVGSAQAIWVILSDGRHHTAELVGTDSNYDLAVIRVPQGSDERFETAPVGNADDLMVGEWVVALGNPYGLYLDDPKPSATVGVVSAVDRDVRITEGSAIYKGMIQTDAAINPGNSGGPLVNALGEVVGINTFIFTQGGGSLGIGFAIPIQTALGVAEELILYGQVRTVWIGISVQRLTPLVADQLEVTDTEGLVVWSLERGSPADMAGIRLGDIIRGVDGRPVSDPQQARRSIFGARVGDTITFRVERGDQLFDIPVTLEPLPAEQNERSGQP